MNESYQHILYKLSMKAYRKNEIPVAAIVVRNGKIISKSYNKRNLTNNPLHHAEIICLVKVSKKLKTWKLSDCDMYVTLEPCPMCKSVINESRIRNVYFLSSKSKSIHYKTKYSLCYNIEFSDLLTSFFKKLRHNNKQ